MAEYVFSDGPDEICEVILKFIYSFSHIYFSLIIELMTSNVILRYFNTCLKKFRTIQFRTFFPSSCTNFIQNSAMKNFGRFVFGQISLCGKF